MKCELVYKRELDYKPGKLVMVSTWCGDLLVKLAMSGFVIVIGFAWFVVFLTASTYAILMGSALLGLFAFFGYLQWKRKRLECLDSERLRLRLQGAPTTPLVPITGVVWPNGVQDDGGVTHLSDDGMFLQLSKAWLKLLAWRIACADVQRRPLIVRRIGTVKEIDKLRESITPYQVIRIWGRLSEESVSGDPQALLEQVLGVETGDEALNEYANELRKPVTFVDGELGTFTLDRRFDWFTTKVDWKGRPVSLNLATTDPATIHGALKTAKALMTDQESWDQRIRSFAMAELHPAYNGYFEDSKDEIDFEEFKEVFNSCNVAADSIKVYAGGAFVFLIDDGSLFWHSTIQISGNVSETE